MHSSVWKNVLSLSWCRASENNILRSCSKTLRSGNDTWDSINTTHWFSRHFATFFARKVWFISFPYKSFQQIGSDVTQATLPCIQDYNTGVKVRSSTSDSFVLFNFLSYSDRNGCLCTATLATQRGGVFLLGVPDRVLGGQRNLVPRAIRGLGPTNWPWTIARCDWHNPFGKSLFAIGLFRCVVDNKAVCHAFWRLKSTLVCEL